MGVLMDMLQQVIDTFKLNVLAVENVPESIRPLINLQEVLPFYRFIALLMLLMQSVGVKEEVLKSIKLFYRRV